MPTPNGPQFQKKSVTCNRCGKEGLQWAQAKSGKYYLTDSEPTAIRNENGRVIKSIRPAHSCEQHRQDQAEFAAFEEKVRRDQAPPMTEDEARENLRKMGYDI